jgi:hypothetical protein
MNTINIPQEFLNIARSMGMPKDIASQFYVRKSNQKADSKDLVHQLALTTYPSENDARQALNRLWVEFNKTNMDAPGIPLEVSARPHAVVKQPKTTYLEQAREALERMIGHLNTPTGFSGKKTVANRIVVGSDLHGIFADEDLFLQFCEDPAPIAVFNGDFFDFISASRFKTTLTHITVREELANARAKAEHLSRSFKTVYFTNGNHDAMRPFKRLMEVAPALLPLIIDPMDLITSDLPNFKRLSTTIQGTAPKSLYGENHKMDSFGMLGDALFGHLEGFCGDNAVKDVEKWLNDWSHVLKLPTSPKAIFQAHTHRLGVRYTAQGRVLVETGCMCRPMPYVFENHGKFSPIVNGYIEMYQYDGKTDLNSIKGVLPNKVLNG